jgi:hypothetical protein
MIARHPEDKTKIVPPIPEPKIFIMRPIMNVNTNIISKSGNFVPSFSASLAGNEFSGAIG